MKRRALIKLVSFSTGAALSAPLLSSLITSCQEAAKIEDTDYTPHFFDQEEFTFLKTTIDTILPKTDSPSATEVGVHKIIDTMVGTVYKPSDRENYKQGFLALRKRLGTSQEINIEALKMLIKSLDEKDKKARKALLELKQQTIAYYLSTEEIAKNHLNYLPVPGNYQSCITLEEAGGKLWAL